MERIVLIPALPQEIKQAVDRQRLAVLVGAGASRIIGCAGWEKLAGDLARMCYDKGYIRFKECDSLLQYSQSGIHRKTISICKHILEQKDDSESFYGTLEAALCGEPDKVERYPIYDELYRFGALFVTTNVDRHFDGLFTERSIVYQPDDFDFDPERGVDHTRLYHLHGTIDHRESLVLTLADYLRCYQHPRIVAFLTHLFADYRVLFLGYGLREFELLEYVKSRHSGEQAEELRHFCLMPFFSEQESILDFEQSYFRDLDIKVLPYRKDEKGYDQLFEVVRHWREEINMLSSRLYKGLGRVEELAAVYVPEHEEELFQLIKNDLPLEDHFLKVVTAPEWLPPLQGRGYLAPNRNPRPDQSRDQPGYYHIPYWNVLDYLERVADQVLSGPDSGVVTTLMQVVRSVSDYRDDNGQRIDNYHTDRSFVKIMARVPVEALQVDDVERVRSYLVESRWRASDFIGAEIGKSLLPRLLDQGATELAAKLLEIVIGPETRQRAGREEPAALVEKFWLNDILERNKPGIQHLFPLEAAQIALREIDQTTAHERSSFNLVWIPAIEEHHQNRFPTRYENILVRAARDFLDSAAERRPEGSRQLLEDLLGRQHPIFPRIALHCIATHWAQYGDLFWPLLGEDLLGQVFLKHELYELLRANHSHFVPAEMDQVLDWIETRPYHCPQDGFVDDEEERRTRAAQKLEWLTALKDTQYQPAREKYHEYLAIAGGETEHPGFSIWMGDVQVGSISPIQVPELLLMDNSELATCVAEYQDGGEWYGVPSKGGLADAFKAAATAEPQKFAEDLTPFLQLPPYYLYYLLWGFNEAWKAKHDFDWSALLAFCLKLIATDFFWSGPPRNDPDYPGSLIMQVANLVEGGTQDDSHAFDESLLPLAEQLLVPLLDRVPSELYQGYNILTAVLNSPKGRVLSAAVNYSRRYARARKGEDAGRRWPAVVKEDFNSRLDRGDDETPEFFATAGQYLAILYWLDKEWVITNIDRIFPKDNHEHWLAAMAGFLWPPRTYRDLFLLLRGHGHYAKALQAEFDDEDLRERLIQQVAIAYLWGDEQLEQSDGLLGGLVGRRATHDLHKAVTYLWMQRGVLESDQLERVLAFWRRLVAVYGERDELTEEERALVIDLAKLAAYLDSLDSEAVGWLEVSVRCFRTEQDAWFLIEDLHRLVDPSPKEVGIVYLEILQSDIYPTFDKDHIIPILEALYERGETDAADRICNLYVARRIDFLRETYQRHHPELENGTTQE